MLRWRSWSLVLVVALVACADGEERTSDGVAAASSAQVAEKQRAKERARFEAERNACLAMRKNIDSIPALAGTPELDEQRHRVLGRAKGWPVVFRRKPVRDLGALQPYFRALAESLEDPRRVYATLKTLRGHAGFSRDQVRAILLPEGYFYAEDPKMARWLVIHFDLMRLFREPEIWLMRGSSVFRLVRDKLGYRYADGPDEGRTASLLMFDRVAVERSALFPALHMDFVPVADEYGFDRVKLERITSVGINAKVRYGHEGPWIDAAFTNEEGKAQLACQLVGEAQQETVKAFRDDQGVRAKAAVRLREAAALQAREGLMFDEPREEEGQQDGSLRPLWLWAYNHGGIGYSFNQVWYPVFDPTGRPIPPQVCIDFVLDTYERASGTWYRGRGAPREQTSGNLNFEKLEMENRRSVESVANYFRENPGMFDIWDLQPEERVRFTENDKFFDFLKDNADRFRSNSVVLIHGPRGDEAHYHSFIIARTDPISGMPIEVMENAGRPRFRSWEAAMRSGPLRSVKHVMIPRTSWLREVYNKPPNTVVAASEGASPPDVVSP